MLLVCQIGKLTSVQIHVFAPYPCQGLNFQLAYNFPKKYFSLEFTWNQQFNKYATLFLHFSYISVICDLFSKLTVFKGFQMWNEFDRDVYYHKTLQNIKVIVKKKCSLYTVKFWIIWITPNSFSSRSYQTLVVRVGIHKTSYTNL